MSIARRPFKINGTTIPTPTTYTYSIEDLSSEETGRTMNGVMHKDVVATKATYACTWKRLSWQDAAILMNAIDGRSRVSFTHADPRVPGTFVTGSFYVGQRQGAALDLKDNKRNWTDISFSFIEI